MRAFTSKIPFRLAVCLRFLVVGCLGQALGFVFRPQSSFNKWLSLVVRGVAYWNPLAFLELLSTIRYLISVTVRQGARLFFIDAIALDRRLCFGWFTNRLWGPFRSSFLPQIVESFDLIHLNAPHFWRYRNASGLKHYKMFPLVSLMSPFSEKKPLFRFIDALIPSVGFHLRDGLIGPDPGSEVLAIFYSFWLRELLQRHCVSFSMKELVYT